jgi:hypothetical protein
MAARRSGISTDPRIDTEARHQAESPRLSPALSPAAAVALARQRCGQREITFDRIALVRTTHRHRWANRAEGLPWQRLGEIMSRWALIKIVLSGCAVSTALTLAYVLIAVGLSG